MIKSVIQNILGKQGYALVRQETKSAFNADRIARLGSPATIIDVGVAGGTYPFYDAFPSANIVLVEPLAEYHQSTLDNIRSKYDNVTLIESAVGEVASTAEISIETASLGKSSLLERTALTEEATGTEKKMIEVQRLDTAISKLGIGGPYAIKVDTEGFELSVVRGCTALIPQVEFFIAEVSIAKRFEGSYTFEEVIGHMDSIGFAVTDMLDFARPDKVGTRFMDLVFRPK
ncbi:MAG: FkbM family methyltransferase [Pseudomonadales bacterium]